jgi:hypothetical protein
MQNKVDYEKLFLVPTFGEPNCATTKTCWIQILFLLTVPITYYVGKSCHRVSTYNCSSYSVGCWIQNLFKLIYSHLSLYMHWCTGGRSELERQSRHPHPGLVPWTPGTPEVHAPALRAFHPGRTTMAMMMVLMMSRFFSRRRTCACSRQWGRSRRESCSSKSEGIFYCVNCMWHKPNCS